MKRYLKLYYLLMRLNYYRALNHRGEFFSGLVGALMWGIFNVVLIYILSSRSSSLFGWSRGELFVLSGVFNMIVGSFFRMIVAENFDRISGNIQHGNLDTWLSKPVDSQFMLSFLYIKYHGLVRFLLSTIFTGIMLEIAHINVGFLDIIAFIILAVFGLIIMYSIWYLVLTFTIWFPDLTNITEILYTTDSTTRYPPAVLWNTGVFLFLIFLPYTLVVSVPTKALIHKLTINEVGIMIITSLGLLFLSRIFWKFALRSYVSSS